MKIRPRYYMSNFIKKKKNLAYSIIYMKISDAFATSHFL